MKPLIFIDLETTHLDHRIGEIIEICIIVDYPDTGNSFFYHHRVKPVHIHTADPDALMINGYKKTLWKNAKPFRQHADMIASLVRYGIIIGHNVSFDADYLRYHLGLAGYDRMTYQKIDTQTLALEHLPIHSVSLKSIRSFFDWSHENAHRADKDCKDMRRLYYKLRRATMLKRMYWKYVFSTKNR